MEPVLFLIYASAACGGALAVVLSQNVVRMAFWLVISLGSLAGLFFLLGAEFLGAAQLLIYVGGTVVLLIFGVMLTASGPYLTIKSSPGDYLMAATVGILLLGTLAYGVMRVDWPLAGEGDSPDTYRTVEEGATAQSVGSALLGTRFDRDLNTNRTEKGSTGYLLPFEIISVHLLVVLVGAAYLARAKRRVRQNPVE
jgi:NADH-quinone oxidoreductase subunit J